MSNLFNQLARPGVNPTLNEPKKGDDIMLSEEEAKAAAEIFRLSKHKGWEEIKKWIEISLEKHEPSPVDLAKDSANINKNVCYNAGYIDALKDLKDFVKKQEQFINNDKYYVPNEDTQKDS